MKKLLALVLALVMTLSLCTVTNAAYPDAADVDYKEAVDVMSAVGVFKGDEKGNFNPDANLTRETAAKLIAYLDLGEKVAEALPAVKVFSDVEANRWSAKYIAYCADAGYIAGVGDGSFNPTGELTGYAFGKLLLCVLGYDANIEGFTGANWSIAVAKLMQSNDIAKGVDKAGSAVLTREEAAQFCLNALKANCVDYKDKGTQISINGATIATGASKAEPVTTGYSAAVMTAITDEDVDTLQLGEKLYDGDLALDGVSVKDDLGRPGHKWTYDDEVGTYADSAKFTYTKAVSADDMAKNLKGYTFATSPAAALVENTKNAQATGGTVANTAAVAAKTGNGVTVEVFANSSKVITDVVVIAPAVGEITGATKTSANKSHGAYTTYTIDTSAASGKIFSSVVDKDNDVDSIVADAALAKEDVVTYYKGAAKLYIDHVTELSGVLSAVSNKNVLTIDGTSYNFSAVNGAVLPTANKKSQDFYLDSFGNVIKAFAETTTNYAYVIPGTVKSINTLKDDGTLSASWVATIAYPDGTFEQVKTSDTWAAYEGKAITYTVNAKDKYVYGANAGKAVAELSDNLVEVATGLKANNATLYVVCKFVDDDDDNTTPKVFDNVTLYTGYKNVPVYTSLIQTVAVDTDSTPDGLANVVFVGDQASAVETGKFVYVTGTYAHTTAGYVYDTIVAGAESTTTKDTYCLEADTLYSAIGATDTKATAVGTTIENKGGLLYINGTYQSGKTIADDVVVYSINLSDDSVSVGTGADLATKVDTKTNDGARGVYVEYDGSKVATVYILFNSED